MNNRCLSNDNDPTQGWKNNEEAWKSANWLLMKQWSKDRGGWKKLGGNTPAKEHLKQQKREKRDWKKCDYDMPRWEPLKQRRRYNEKKWQRYIAKQKSELIKHQRQLKEKAQANSKEKHCTSVTERKGVKGNWISYIVIYFM